jgi:hypothetical protein
MPVAGDEERPMPDARRTIDGSQRVVETPGSTGGFWRRQLHGAEGVTDLLRTARSLLDDNM